MRDDFLVVGRIVGAQGLKGELKIQPASDFPSRFTEPGPRWLKGNGQPLKQLELISGRPVPGKALFVVRFAGIDDRSSAEALLQHDFLVDSEDRPELEEGEVHVLDLQGLEVRLTRDGAAIGTVHDLHHGGNDLLEIELKADQRRCLVPFVEAIVPEVNLEGGWLLLTPPEGLLEA